FSKTRTLARIAQPSSSFKGDLMTKEKHEYQAKVSDDNGIRRSKVPSPLLRIIGAKPGDYLAFKVAGPKSLAVKLVKKRKRQ
ncbi:MAG TPA: hypothetical protein VGB17_10255, partial [Pyrinomonadaceae bacterium]